MHGLSSCAPYVVNDDLLVYLLIFFSLITSSTNGYDGSMMNGLQSLTQWTGYFNNPSGGRLGLLNAIQACFLCLLQTRNDDMVLIRTSVVWLPTLFPLTSPMVWVVVQLSYLALV